MSRQREGRVRMEICVLPRYADALKTLAVRHGSVGKAVEQRASALANCYLMARRQSARFRRASERFDPVDEKSREAFEHIIRFCESAGDKANLLRDSLPTDMTEGTGARARRKP